MEKIDKYLLRLMGVMLVVFMAAWLYAMIAPNIGLTNRVNLIEQSYVNKANFQQFNMNLNNVLNQKQDKRR